MARNLLRLPRPVLADVDDFSGARLGTLVGIDADGRPLVRFPDGPPVASPARLAVSAPPPGEEELRNGVPVVLLFERGHGRRRPVIVGFVRDRFEPPAPRPLALTSAEPRTLEINGTAVIVEGKDEIVLRCGLGSLTIRANGQIVVKGTRLVSRASETNKIRGASVQIN
jgi:hypothetical protein